MNLNEIAKDIRNIVGEYQKKYYLSFEEEHHEYEIVDDNGVFRKDYPSVSSLLKMFKQPFDSHSTKAFLNCNGIYELEKELLLSWNKKADISINKGSRTHYSLETYIMSLYGNYKAVRQPFYNCTVEETKESDKMIQAGKDFIHTMHDRKCVLLDTETVLGSTELKYFGQFDNSWLTLGKNGQLGFIISDYKTNAPKNFEVKPYNNLMLEPFQNHYDYALTHYFIQIPLYAKLLKHMLKGSKYEDIDFLGGLVVLLKKDATYTEYRVPKEIINIIFNMEVHEEYQNRKHILDLHNMYYKRDNELKYGKKVLPF